jgi:tetratricopeptide (TPR) repeat protein
MVMGAGKPGRAAAWTVAAVGALLLTMPTLAQQSGQSSSSGQPDPKTQQGTSKPAPPPPATQPKSAAQENPFPADQSKQAAQQQQQQGSDGAPDAPDAGEASAPAAAQPGDAKPGNAAKDNPFPEDLSKAAAAAAANGNNPGATDASSSSSSSSSSSNPGSSGGDPNADVPGDTGRHRLRKPSPKDIESGSLAGQGRAEDDVRVGRYYLNDGDYKGAYGRFEEAARLDPGNIDAIYGLAAAADKLHHKDEALTNYKLYLDVAPNGTQAKAARKALEGLSR